MKSVKLPLGNSDFREIRENNLFFVDKSLLIEDILRQKGTKAFLFTRPRRFGKSLNMSMLSSFFDITKDSRKLFEGLAIAKNATLCNEWMNKYPTIFISFKEVDGQSFESGFGRVCSTMKNLFFDYLYLLSSDKVYDVDKESFNRIHKDVKPSIDDIKDSLNLLMRMLYCHYGKKVILLIDEYDVPINKAHANGYYKEMLDLMRGILQVLKDNDKLQFAVITGCLRIAKESIFTGLNNLYTNSIIDCIGFEEYFGFTEAEVRDAFEDMGIPEKLAVAKEWYDGYRFGDWDIYCPWDVINYLNDLGMNEASEPKNYWANTSGNQIIESFVSNGSRRMLECFDRLLAGEYIIKTIDDNITYDYLSSDDDNIWAVLLMTGYLTTLRNNEIPFPLEDDKYALRIPNKEVMSIFSKALSKWVKTISKKENLDNLDNAIWNGDAETIGKEITRILNKTLSYNDLYHEYVYHLFLNGLFSGMGYTVASNKEFGMGRPDIVIFDSGYKKAILFEIKTAGKTVDDAVKQIDEKKYLDGLTGIDFLISYGIRFEGKTAEVKLKDKIER